MLRILAIISDLLLLAVLVSITKRVGKGTSVSISAHASSNKWAYWLFATALTLCGSVLSLYLIIDVAIQFELNTVFYFAAFVGWVCLLITAWVAEDTEKYRFKNTHWLAANLLAAMMGLMLYCVAGTPRFYMFTRLVAVMFASWYFYVLYLTAFKTASKVLNYYMLIQYFNIISFTTLVLAVTYFD